MPLRNIIKNLRYKLKKIPEKKRKFISNVRNNIWSGIIMVLKKEKQKNVG